MTNFKEQFSIFEKSFINTGPESFSKAFLIPALKVSNTYKRSVGYFTSGAVIHLLDGLEGLVSNNGKIKIICSPQLSEEDIEAIQLGQKNKDEVVSGNFYSTLVIGMRQVSNDKSKLLIYLIENGILEFKLALSETYGIYHDKLGIVEDLDGNKVCFVGSLNETLQAYTKNYEKVRLFYSWKNEDDLERINEEEEYFDRLWDDRVDFLKVQKLSPEIVQKVVRLKPEFESTQEDIVDIPSVEEVPKESYASIQLRPYQLEAISSWKDNNFHGILSMATGTGKTFTAIQALIDIIDSRKGEPLFVYIVVPYQVLLNQWNRELARFGLESEEARGASGAIVIENAGRMLRYKATSYQIIVTTSASFDSNKYSDIISNFEIDVFFLADEVHNLGTSSKLGRIPTSKYKLGLSATPQRHFDDFGTARLLEIFRGIVYEFDLERAIKENFLVPYNYHPVYTTLTSEEQEKYDELTVQIVRALQIKDEREVFSKKLNPIAERLLIKRARIILGAVEKVNRFFDEYKRFDKGQMNLVYCGAASQYDEDTDEPIRQIDQITEVFFKNNIKSIRYTSDENEGLREVGLSLFVNEKNDINTIVAIKCLDEGLDIPQVENAFILGSTTNDKEFIQRRGRVLRKHKGKTKAEIIDFVVMPNPTSDKGLGIVLREMNRVYEYNRYSMNASENQPKIMEILNQFNIDLEEIAGE
jgi:superfamily II DNA or RNA helicase